MLFDKLPVVLLSTMATERDDSINCRIATYILENLRHIPAWNITELAQRCAASPSSVTRFCRDIGLEGFTELRELMASTQMAYDNISADSAAQSRYGAYMEHMRACQEQVCQSLDSQKITQLCRDIYRYPKVAVFGLMKAATAALNLQSDLLMQGKITKTKIPYQQQYEYLSHVTEDDLILIFSYTGVYFDYSYRIPDCLKKARVYVITGNRDLRENAYFDEIVPFCSRQDPSSHPYQMQLVGHIIAQEYAYMKNQGAFSGFEKTQG